MMECRRVLVLRRSDLGRYGVVVWLLARSGLSLMAGLEPHYFAFRRELGSIVVYQNYGPLWPLEGD